MKNRIFCLFLVIMILLSNIAYASEADDLERYLSDADISEIYAHNLAMTDVWLLSHLAGWQEARQKCLCPQQGRVRNLAGRNDP